MNRLNALAEKKSVRRQTEDSETSRRVLEDAGHLGVKISVVGSLAKNTFKAHSDLDLLVHGSSEPGPRALVEHLVAKHLRGIDLPYDMIFAADLT